MAAIFVAVMDKISFHYNDSIFSKLNELFWNPKESWRNKWKKGTTDKERFPLSSTVLVGLTDAWHLFKSLAFSSMIAAVVLYEPVFGPLIDLAIMRVGIYPIFFHTFFTYIFKKR